MAESIYSKSLRALMAASFLLATACASSTGIESSADGPAKQETLVPSNSGQSDDSASPTAELQEGSDAELLAQVEVIGTSGTDFGSVGQLFGFDIPTIAFPEELEIDDIDLSSGPLVDGTGSGTSLTVSFDNSSETFPEFDADPLLDGWAPSAAIEVDDLERVFEKIKPSEGFSSELLAFAEGGLPSISYLATTEQSFVSEVPSGLMGIPDGGEPVSSSASFSADRDGLSSILRNHSYRYSDQTAEQLLQEIESQLVDSGVKYETADLETGNFVMGGEFVYLDSDGSITGSPSTEIKLQVVQHDGQVPSLTVRYIMMP